MRYQRERRNNQNKAFVKTRKEHQLLNLKKSLSWKKEKVKKYSILIKSNNNTKKRKKGEKE